MYLSFTSVSSPAAPTVTARRSQLKAFMLRAYHRREHPRTREVQDRRKVSVEWVAHYRHLRGVSGVARHPARRVARHAEACVRGGRTSDFVNRT